MMLFSWSDDLNTGIKAIDAQHRELIRRVNAFLDECQAGDATRRSMVKTFDFLRLYVIEHFGIEFALMEEYDYPESTAHKKAHEQLREWVETTARQLETADIDTNLTLDIGYHFVDWLRNHIQNTDKRMSAHLRRLADTGKHTKLLDLIKGVFPGTGKK